MARTFAESIDYLLHDPKLTRAGLETASGKIETVTCRKDECRDATSPFTNLLCEACRRCPLKLDALWWIAMVILLIVFQTGYFWHANWSAETGFLILIGAFDVWVLLFTFFIILGVFKGKSTDASVIAGTAAALVLLMSYISLKYGSDWSGLLIYLLVALLVLWFIWQLVNGSRIFCKKNDLSWLVPFFIVLPLNYLAYTLIKMIPLVERLVTDARVRAMEITSSAIDLNGHTLGRAALTAIEWSSEIRLVLLSLFLVLVVWFFGILPALKAKNRRYKVLEYIYDLIMETGKNLGKSVFPIFRIWWYVTTYALTKSIVAPLIYAFILLETWTIFVVWPISDGGLTIKSLLSLGGIASCFILLPAFVLFAANYPLGLDLIKRVYNDGVKSLYTVLFALLFFAVVCDLLKDYAWGIFTPSITLVVAGTFYVGSVLYFGARKLALA